MDRAKSLFSTLTALTLETGAVDGSTEQRLVLYSSAFEAFKDSPLFGHGFNSFAMAAGKHMPEEHAGMRNSEHIHSDIADFAVIGGTLGLLAQALFLIAPLLVHLNVVNIETRRAVLLGGTVLSVGYFGLGLTNAVFGILPQTVLFGASLGVLIGIARAKTHSPLPS